jgi:hypothetical protein
MKWLADKLGLAVNDFLKSTLTLLLFFALVALAAWFLLKRHVPAYAAGGFAAGAFYFLLVNTRNNGGSEGDSGSVFSGGLNDIINSGRTGDTGGTLRDPNIYNNLGSDLGL